MSTAKIQNYEQFKPASGNVKAVVLLLHGLGANGQDLIGLAPMMAQALPDTLFISPDAPYPCDMAPFGYQWFSLQDREPAAMLAGAQDATPALHMFMDEILKRHSLPPGRMALAGFSQGTMMGLYAGLRYPAGAPAGILGYSGALLWDESAEAKTLHHPPVHLIHGDMDNVVPVLAYHYARRVLESHSYSVTGYVQPGLMHGIDDRGVVDGTAFLKRILF